MDSTYKFEIEKFDGSNDFELWKVKMLAYLGNMGLLKALEGKEKLPTTMGSAKKEEVLEKAFNTLVLSLGDNVLRKVTKCKTADELWSKLESIYTMENDDKMNDFEGQTSELESPDGYCLTAWVEADGWDDNNFWVVSTACTFHMTPNRNWFETYEKVSTGKVTFINGASTKVAGIGNVRVKLHDGADRILTNVRYVPGLARNFISVVALGGCMASDPNGLTVTTGSKVVVKGEYKYGTCVLQGSTVIGGAATYTSLDSSCCILIWVCCFVWFYYS